MDLPLELYKEIFNYFDDIEIAETLRLVNKLFLKISNEIQIECGVVIQINSDMMHKFVNIRPNKITWIVIDKISKICFERICEKIDNSLYTTYNRDMNTFKYDSYCYHRHYQIEDFKFYDDMFSGNNTHHIFPLKEIIIYYINKHYLLTDNISKSQNSKFIQKSFLRTTNYYTDTIRKYYPSNNEYADFYLKLMNLSDDLLIIKLYLLIN